MDKDFGGIVWTKHALSRMRERGIKQGDAWAAWRNPEQSRKSKNGGSWVYYKTYNQQTIEVVAKRNDEGKWIVLSVWSKPVGSYQKAGKKSSLLQKIVRRVVWGKVKLN